MTSDPATSATVQQIKSDLTTAMKARDAVTTSTLRMMLAAITNAEVAGASAVVLTDDEVIRVLQSEVKKRSESATIYRDAGRLEQADQELAEVAVIERYLPARLGDDELEAIVDAEIAANGAVDMKSMGAVIKAVRDRVGAAADGATISQMVKTRLGA